MVMQGYMSVYW